MKRRAIVGLVLAAALASASSDAEPTSTDKAMAIQLYEDAQRLMTSGRAAEACPKYVESQRRDPQLGTLLHLAHCYEMVGKMASAWASFKEASEIAARRNAAGMSEPREQTARARAAALEPKLARLVISVPDDHLEGLEIREGDEIIGRAAWGSPLPTDPGFHTITARAPGKKRWLKTVEVSRTAQRVTVVIPELEDEVSGNAVLPAAVLERPTTLPPAMTPSPIETTEGSGATTLAYVLAGVGVAGIAVGTPFGLMTNVKVKRRDAICQEGIHCTPEDNARIQELTGDAQRNALIFNLGVGTGVAALIGAGILALSASRRTAPRSPSAIELRSWSDHRSAGVTLRGAW